MNSVVFCILITEAAERFAYFGFRAVLVLYFTTELEFEDSEIVENNNRIFRIFSKHNLEDILEELEMDGSDFAVKTYSNLINKDKKLL